jgi:acetyltransferase
MLASASPGLYADCLKILLADEGVDAVLLILPPPPMYHTEEVADALIPIINSSEKPVLVTLMGSELTREASNHFLRADIPTYAFPERAASALGILTRRQDQLVEQEGGLEEIPEHNTAPASIPAEYVPPEELVAAYGIPVSPMVLAVSAEAAAETARELGFPIVMKVASPDIPHKSDIGGILLNLADEEGVRKGYETIMARVQSARPEARVIGVHLQNQLPAGQEVIVGMLRDAQFGALLIFGSGGTEVEGLHDVAFALGPLTHREAENLVRRTWAGRKLDGFRNIPQADKAAAIDVVVQLSRLAEDNPEVVEIEINPLRVFDHGAVAIDIRVRLRE